MDEDIQHYYERELTFIRETGTEFARKYPKIAGRLLLDPESCEDPHTERLVEATAFLGSRIHKKLDGDFPDITEAMLNILYPHYTAPIPSMSVVEFEPSDEESPAGGYTIAKGTSLDSLPAGGVSCRFRTGYPVTLWPVEVVSATLEEPSKAVKNARQVIIVRLKTRGNLLFSQLCWERLRFFLNGWGQQINHLYELLFNNVCHVECVSSGSNGTTSVIPLKPCDIVPVGFNPDEALIPFQQRSFPGYLLLFEYFCFPEKFHFFDLEGLGKIKGAGFGDTMDLRIYLDRKAKSNLLIDSTTFRLNAAPVVNLFRKIAEPIRITREKTEYRVIPDIRKMEATEVFSIDRVSSLSDSMDQKKEYQPFYLLRRHFEGASAYEKQAFWHLKRKPADKKGDSGNEVFISFTDPDFQPSDHGEEIVTAHVTCTNRDLPGRIAFGDSSAVFVMEPGAPVSSIKCLIKPTMSRRPSLGGALQWRLVSHLSLNYLSLVEGGVDALGEILKLYDFDDSAATRQQIDGIVALRSGYSTKRIGRSLCRGVQVEITFDEDKYVGTGLYLFAAVLERFIGQYVSVNSFSQVTANTLQRKERLKVWPPRSRDRILL